MKKTLFFVALAIGLSSCTDNKTILTVEEVVNGHVLQIESTVSMNVPGDSIVICETFFSSRGSHYSYYGNLAPEIPEDYFSNDTLGVYAKNYFVAVVKKVER